LQVLEHEHVYLDTLPSAEMYEKSFMHRDVITHVVRPRTRSRTLHALAR
jgi:peptidylprolyl isomerase domain and WD repeat-containing protein 1